MGISSKTLKAIQGKGCGDFNLITIIYNNINYNKEE